MDDEFLKRLFETFKIEAEEHLRSISTGLIKFEKTGDEIERQSIIEPVYRAAHSLKGAARAVNLIEIERLCQNIENVFAALKKYELKQSSILFDNLHKGLDLISSYITSNIEEQKSQIALEMEDIINNLNEQLVLDYQEPPKISQIPSAVKIEKKQHIDKSKPEPISITNLESSIKLDSKIEKTLSTETVRIAASKLDTLLLQGEEMLTTKLSFEELTKNIYGLEDLLNKWNQEFEKIGTQVRKIKEEYITNIGGYNSFENFERTIKNFFNLNNKFFKQFNEEIQSLAKHSLNSSHTLGHMINRLIDDMKEILMLPFSFLLDLFPKMVRDISRDIGKKIDLEITGSDLMIDRRILEEMKDPLIHLVRNSIDHGIENPEERRKQGKEETGRINISIKPAEGNKIEIKIEDDGQGLNFEKIKEGAIKQGFISESEAQKLSNQEVISLIFQSGISTSKKVTDISGRGLGMAIVKDKVEKLSGNIKITSNRGKGSSFTIYLPLTLSTFRGIILKCCNNLFVIQTVYVQKVMRIKSSEIETVENKETILVNNIPISLVYLGDILGIKKTKEYSERDYFTVIILSSVDKNIAFAIDEIIDEQEILIKQFNYQLIKIKNIAGATILGNGKVVPVLDVSDIIKSAEKPSKHSIKKIIKEVKRHKILVADDSITARTLLRDILEASGYEVKTYIDGIEALTALKSEQFDIIVTDIEMPRMNGFELTTQIRKNTNLSELPIVLVTALAKSEDREKGIDAGANAYIVKSSFDQSDLLSVIRRLL